MVERVDIIPVLWNFRPCRTALDQEVPELLWVRTITWRPHANADDGNGLVDGACGGTHCVVETKDLKMACALGVSEGARKKKNKQITKLIVEWENKSSLDKQDEDWDGQDW